MARRLEAESQPQEDIHDWNAKHLFEKEVTREECKQRFFAWLYEPTSTDVKEKYYNREKILDKWYKEGYIYTPYKRKIAVEERKALNYLLQSTTSDRVLSKATKIDEFLTENNCKSYISHIVHDEIVLDRQGGDALEFGSTVDAATRIVRRVQQQAAGAVIDHRGHRDC